MGWDAEADESNFILKHWALEHGSNDKPPLMRFSVVQTHMDAMTRLIQKAVLIETDANMNSKAEWRQNSKVRLVFEKSEWEKKKLKVEELKREVEEKSKMDRVIKIVESMRPKGSMSPAVNKQRGREFISSVKVESIKRKNNEHKNCFLPLNGLISSKTINK